LHFRQPKAREPGGNDLLRRRFLQIGAAGFLLPVARKNSGDPMRELVLEELDVRKGVVRSRRHRIAFEVRPSGRVDHVDERAGLTEIVEEFIAYATALIRLSHQTSDIEQLDGYAARGS